MPKVPEDFDWDLDQSGSRFVRRPALAIGVAEAEWGVREPEEEFRSRVGDWLLEEQEELGQGTAVRSGVGRGAEGLAAAFEFFALHAAGGVISVAAGMAFKRVWQRAREALGGQGKTLMVSRGGAAALAAGDVADRFDERDPVEIEAVEEPSSIAGREVSELSYVGLEPWIVLLRNRDRRIRYLVVVAADGEILGSVSTPMDEFEAMFLPNPKDSEWAQPPARRRRWSRLRRR